MKSKALTAHYSTCITGSHTSIITITELQNISICHARPVNMYHKAGLVCSDRLGRISHYVSGVVIGWRTLHVHCKGIGACVCVWVCVCVGQYVGLYVMV